MVHMSNHVMLNAADTFGEKVSCDLGDLLQAWRITL